MQACLCFDPISALTTRKKSIFGRKKSAATTVPKNNQFERETTTTSLEKWDVADPDNKTVVIQAIKEDLDDDNVFRMQPWRHISDRLLDDEDVAYELVGLGGMFILVNHLPQKYLDNKRIVRQALEVTKDLRIRDFEKVSWRLLDDKAFALMAVQKSGRLLGSVSYRMREIERIVLAAVRNDGSTLTYASNALKNHKKIVLEAVRNYGYALQFASTGLRDDDNVVLAAVRNNGLALEFASLRTRGNKKIIMEAARQNGECLQFVKRNLFPKFERDEDIIKLAVASSPSALRFASYELKWNPSVVFEALRHDATREMFHDYHFNKSLQQFGKRLLHMHIKHVSIGSYVLYPILSSVIPEYSRCIPNQLGHTKKHISTSLWLSVQCKRVWLISNLSTESIQWTGCRDVHRCIMEFVGFRVTSDMIKELKECEPVINRLIDFGWTIGLDGMLRR